jgi:hypothetical protein
MSKEAIAYYAAKFFPHLLPVYGQEIVRLMVKDHLVDANKMV